jgi:hypothetical protein
MLHTHPLPSEWPVRQKIEAILETLSMSREELRALIEALTAQGMVVDEPELQAASGQETLFQYLDTAHLFAASYDAEVAPSQEALLALLESDAESLDTRTLFLRFKGGVKRLVTLVELQKLQKQLQQLLQAQPDLKLKSKQVEAAEFSRMKNALANAKSQSVSLLEDVSKGVRKMLDAILPPPKPEDAMLDGQARNIQNLVESKQETSQEKQKGKLQAEKARQQSERVEKEMQVSSQDVVRNQDHILFTERDQTLGVSAVQQNSSQNNDAAQGVQQTQGVQQGAQQAQRQAQQQQRAMNRAQRQQQRAMNRAQRQQMREARVAARAAELAMQPQAPSPQQDSVRRSRRSNPAMAAMEKARTELASPESQSKDMGTLASMIGGSLAKKVVGGVVEAKMEDVSSKATKEFAKQVEKQKGL